MTDIKQKIPLWRGLRGKETPQLLFCYPEATSEITFEEYEAIEKQWKEYTNNLLFNKDIIIQEIKRRIAWCKNKQKSLLKEYQELKYKNSKYDARKRLADKMAILKKIEEELFEQGRIVKNLSVSLLKYLSPSDKQKMETLGTDEFLKQNWEYLLADCL